MSCLIAFEISVVLASLTLFLIHMYLYTKEPKKYICLWSLGWGIYVVKYLFKISISLSNKVLIFRIGEWLSLIWASFFLVRGTYSFLNRKMPWWWLFFWAGLNIYAIVGIVYDFPFHPLSIVAIAIHYLWIGYVFLKTRLGNGIGRYLTGSVFFLWGIHLANSPFVKDVTTFFAVRYAISTILLLIGAFGILITYFEKNHDKLLNSEYKFRQLFYNASDAMILHDFDNKGMPGTIIDVNDRMCRMLGYSKAELKTMILNDVGLHLNQEQKKQLMEEEFVRNGEQFTFKSIVITKEGKEIPVKLSCCKFTINGDEVGLSVIRDISKWIAVKKALRENEERYRRLIEFIPDSIVVYSNGRAVFTNKAAVNLVGAKNEKEIIEKPIMWYVHSDYKEIALRKIRMAQEREEVQMFEYKVVRCDDTIVDVEALAVPILYRQDKAVLYIGRDITERKRAEELHNEVEEKNRLLNEVMEMDKLKTEFFSNVSHELRTPLNIILSTMQLFDMYLSKGTFLSNVEKVTQRIKIMRQNCFRLLRLINNLIDITKIDAGFLKIEMQNINIVGVVKDITLSIIEFVESRGITLEFYSEMKEKFVGCDPDKIERIILNLLSNAVKFTKPGGNIAVSLYDERGYIVISVKDTGIGIPEDKLEVIFERFRQVDSIMTKDYEGSGIGLSLVKKLVEMHDGTISVKSEYGKGSEFMIKLPPKTVHNVKVKRDESSSRQSRIEKINIEFSDIYSVD